VLDPRLLATHLGRDVLGLRDRALADTHFLSHDGLLLDLDALLHDRNADVLALPDVAARRSPLDGTPLDDDLLVRDRHVHVALFGDDVLADRHLTRLLGARVRLQLLLMELD
jgi:hypothetical protein